MLKMAITVVQPLIVCVSDYVRLLDLNGRVKTARRHHSVVDMQFEFRIEALGNNSSLWIVIFSRFVTFIFALHKQQLVTTVVGWFVLDKVLDLSTAVETSPTSGRLDLQNFWLAYSLTLSAFLPWLAIAAVAGILSSYDADVFCCAEPLFMPRFVSCECNEFQYFFSSGQPLLMVYGLFGLVYILHYCHWKTIWFLTGLCQPSVTSAIDIVLIHLRREPITLLSL